MFICDAGVSLWASVIENLSTWLISFYENVPDVFILFYVFFWASNLVRERVNHPLDLKEIICILYETSHSELFFSLVSLHVYNMKGKSMNSRLCIYKTIKQKSMLKSWDMVNMKKLNWMKASIHSRPSIHL